MSEPWWIRHEKLKAQFAPVAREEARQRRRQITEACFRASDGGPCRYLKWEWKGSALVVKNKTCSVKRCPLEKQETEET
jgi:hypothetical protein